MTLKLDIKIYIFFFFNSISFKKKFIKLTKSKYKAIKSRILTKNFQNIPNLEVSHLYFFTKLLLISSYLYFDIINLAIKIK